MWRDYLRMGLDFAGWLWNSLAVRLVVSVLGTAGFAALALLLVEPGELVDALSSVDYRFLAPSVALYFAALWLRAKRWRCVLQASGVTWAPVSAYSAVVLGCAANNVMPARLGEAVRAWVFCRRNRGARGGVVFSTILVERTFDAFFLSALGSLMLALLLWSGRVVDGTAGLVMMCLLALLAYGAAVWFAVLLVMAGRKETFRRLRVVFPLFPRRYRRRAFRWLLHTRRGVSGMQSVVCCRRVMGWTAVTWLTEALVFACAAYGFGVDQFPGGGAEFLLMMALVMAVANCGASVPLALGGVGLFELAGSRALALVGVTPAVALGFPLMVHLLVTWLPVNCAGLGVALWWSLRRERRQVSA